MSPSALTPELQLPDNSALQDALNTSKSTLADSPHPTYFHHLASTILHNLQYQHDWTSLAIHTNLQLPRPIISGLPPRRAYIHPDEQVEILKAEHDTGAAIEQVPELEWVLPTHWEEKWSLSKFAAVFDTLDTVPPTGDDSEVDDEEAVGYKWQKQEQAEEALPGNFAR